MDQPIVGLALIQLALFGNVADVAHSVLSILAALIALGLVIFVHEFGHFAVAKLCGVKCEKFFLGFDINGKKLWSRQWGETEYGIGVLPLGGYVKMLGQDDNPAAAAEERERAKLKAAPAAASLDDDNATGHRSGLAGDLPHEPTTEDREVFDPRSYMAKSVPQRMAIISAGVIMNLIFAVIFATIAYRWGVSYTPCVIGSATPGDPAWIQGIRPGDHIVAFDGNRPSKHLRYFEDLLPTVLFTGSDSELKIVLQRPAAGPDQTSPATIDVTVRPTDAHKKEQDGRSIIGVVPAESNELAEVAGSASPTIPDTSAAEAKPAFKGGDRIVAADVDSTNHKLQNGVQIQALLAQHAQDAITFTVSRENESDPSAAPAKLTVQVKPAPLHDLGLIMQMGPIAAVQKGSPADTAGFHGGDRIKSIEGQAVGDPTQLPDMLALLAGKQITVEVSRGDAGHETSVALRPTPRPPLDYNRNAAPGLLGCDALGIAYPVLNIVKSVRADASPPAQQGIHAGDIIVSVEFSPSEEQKKEFDATGPKFPTEPIKFDDDHLLWPQLQALVQLYPTGVKMKLTLKRGEKDVSATLQTISVPHAFYPGRGLLLQMMSEIRKVDSMTEAAQLGWRETKESVLQIVTILRKLASGGMPATGLGGPGTIAVVAAVSASQGIPKLLIFLTLLSANLAVINFLPIPILDGGHMMFLLYEGIRGKPASERVQMYLTYFGLAIILTLFVFVIGLDINRLIHWISSLFSG